MADDAPMPYQVSIKGEGIAVERSIGQAQALQIVSYLLGGQLGATAAPQQATATGTGQPGAAATTQPSNATGMTVGEYLYAVEAKTNPQKILAIGEHLTQQGRTTFSREDVQGQFPSAGEAVPRNYPRDFTAAIRNRWIAGSPGQDDQYIVTNTGRTALGAKFEGTRSAPSRRRASKTSRKTPSKASRGRAKKTSS